MVNKVTFERFRGTIASIAPSPWIRPRIRMSVKCVEPDGRNWQAAPLLQHIARTWRGASSREATIYCSWCGKCTARTLHSRLPTLTQQTLGLGERWGQAKKLASSDARTRKRTNGQKQRDVFVCRAGNVLHDHWRSWVEDQRSRSHEFRTPSKIVDH